MSVGIDEAEERTQAVEKRTSAVREVVLGFQKDENDIFQDCGSRSYHGSVGIILLRGPSALMVFRGKPGVICSREATLIVPSAFCCHRE